jgi:cyclopropane fatty-acyl-phospholipid synthase-like methyltransferase
MTLARLYCKENVLVGFLVWARPAICDFSKFISFVPENAKVLDFGCGAGGALLEVASTRSIAQGTGCDINHDMVNLGAKVAGKAGLDHVDFTKIADMQDIPEGPFDCVMMIDVMHHIPPNLQKQYFLAVVQRLRPGGRFIYKDMANKPAHKANWNRLHDLLLARQIINYVDWDDIKTWAQEAQLSTLAENRWSQFLYAHELMVFEKT